MSEFYSNKLTAACALSIALSSTGIAPVMAQEDEDFIDEIPILEEIIVTARKRQESLQDTPVAVSALSAETLKEAGITNTRDLQQTVPGLIFAEQGTKNPSAFIRGVGQREAAAALDPGVGVYINNIYIARSDAQLLDTVDTQSVQVLRGPQGTLFGKNNVGGAILVTTQQPHTEGTEGYVTTRIGNYGRRDLKVGANIPLNDDSLSARVSAASVKRDGYFTSTANGNEFGDEDRLAATARLLWQANDVFSVDLFAYWSKQNERGAPFNCFFANEEANFSQFSYRNGETFKDACNASAEAYEHGKVTIEGSTKFIMESSILAATLTWEFEDYEFKSITSFSAQDNIVREDDQDTTHLTILANGNQSFSNTLNLSGIPHGDEERDQFSQEFQLIGSAFDESLQFTIGAFYASEEMRDNPFSQLIGPNAFMRTYNPFLGQMGVHQFLAMDSDLNNETFAVFAQGTYDVTDWFQLTLGGRYTIENRERDATAYFVNNEQLALDLQRVGTQNGVPGASTITYNQGLGLFHYPSEDAFYQLEDLYQTIGIPLVSVTDTASSHPNVKEANPDLKRDDTWKKFTPNITASFNIPQELFADSDLDSALLYLTYSRGFKGGGFDNKNGSLVKFDPEEIDNLEMGIKLDAYDHRLRFNTALYRMQYDDLQIRVAQKGEQLSQIFLYIDNAGKATIEGMELELTVLPINNLTISATANYTNASYDEFMVPATENDDLGIPQEVIVDRSEEEYPGIPELSMSITASYDWATDKGMVIPRLTGYYSGEVYSGIDHISPNYDVSTIDSYTLWSFRVAYIPVNMDTLNLTLYVDNLTDEAYFQGGFTVAQTVGAATLTPGAPRTYGLEMTYNFF